MSATPTEKHSVTLGVEQVPILLRRSNRATLGIAVRPDASVVVTAPRDAELGVVLQQVERKASWILQSRREFALFLPSTPERRFVPGETHLYLGREHRLAVEVGERGVRREGGRLVVGQRRAGDTGSVEASLRRWYRARANEILPERLDAALEHFRTERVARPILVIRRLSKRWGSMSPKGTSMLLNVRLVEADRDEIDYVIVHELCHALHADHGAKFLALLQRKMPDWRQRKRSLERRFA